MKQQQHVDKCMRSSKKQNYSLRFLSLLFLLSQNQVYEKVSPIYNIFSLLLTSELKKIVDKFCSKCETQDISRVAMYLYTALKEIRINQIKMS